ncbi:DsbA family protein [Lactobacillus sp. ESL0785]|uniref:DsbA family protein n=1 Tax=Lactobacillus sp. ESL0785 TaxID=2983232 RepID=UPI0023F6F8AC|nr:DsbA family protein [Lactobacillus sp. ESL0785]WEV71350.1 DsbA family protein [Lactobacillus sp. ESL0785]
MFEIFLFVNPIGIYCYDTEVLIKQAINELNIDTSFHFIPITNTEVIKHDIIRRKKDGQKAIDIPQYTIAAFQTLRIYHAIKFEYGNKKARYYLIKLQQALNRDFNVYSEKLQQEIIKKLNLNFKRLKDPKISKYIDDSIERDKQLAKKSKVYNIPTTVIYNESGNYNGIMLEGLVAHDKLIRLFKNDSRLIDEKKQPTANVSSVSSGCHLRLI